MTSRSQAPLVVEFNRDVRPILSDACFQCHGPDKAKRKAKLRFDSEEGARADLGGYFAIVPGKLDESEMIKRITTADKTKQMPPPSAAIVLTAGQIDTLKRWVAQGAAWQKHWAFLPPQRAPLPVVKDKAWPINPIDYFVLARLEKEGLRPSPEADAATLVRRLSLDLTGLPPTPGEVDEFRKAWESASAKREAILGELVDRLLSSPRYGERMAQRWLDGARYADTNGYQTDGERTMWRWRDWVIEAFNANMPFDRFTIEQIAGDMLPGATLQQKIATGFNRNHRGNSEGGVIPEEFAVEYVVDRVDTTSTVWLGLTTGCARCHDHKYDPVSQKEFYQLFAYFNNVPERGKAIKYGNSPPYIKAPTRDQQKKLLALETLARSAKERFEGLQSAIDLAQRAWEASVDHRQTIEWWFTRHQTAHFPLNDLDIHPEKALRALNGEPTIGAGRIGKAVYLDGRSYLDVGEVGAFGFFDKFSMGAWIKPNGGLGGSILSRMVDTDRADGYNLTLQGSKVHVHLVKRWLDDAIRIETEETLVPDRWHHVFFTYDGSREAKGIKVYLDGRPAKVKVNLDDLNQNFATSEPLRIGAGGGQRFHGAIDDVRIFNDVIAPVDVAVIADIDTIPAIIALPADRRTSAQRHKLRTYFLEMQAPAEIREAYRTLLTSAKTLEQFDATIPTSMVMEEIPTPRDTHILLRGEYDKRGVKVLPALPSALPGIPKGSPNNRLGLGRWLVSSDNPLTARVTANRYWQMLFGAGIVRTVEDFGAQGDWPSHPELLDWLAVEFMLPGGRPLTPGPSPPGGRGEKTHPPLPPGGEGPGVRGRSVPTPAPIPWDIKRLLKTIVTSATYRQSSRVTPALHQRDPENRLLARGPRFRLSADVIRDQALYASGLLVESIGGPSVKPYQPSGLAKELTGTDDYLQDHGPNLYRRSLYTFWKRTIAPPTLMNFDAANRETCVVRETRTNTPLQALNLMNDVTFVEAARMLAQRLLKHGATPETRLALAFRLAAARTPTPAELRILRTALDRHRAHYRQDRAAALRLVSTGETPRDHSLDVAEHAAYAAVCNLILNLDEVITKE